MTFDRPFVGNFHTYVGNPYIDIFGWVSFNYPKSFIWFEIARAARNFLSGMEFALHCPDMVTDQVSSEAGVRCPYLKDTTVKYCRVSAIKKMIVQTPQQAEQEKCSSEDYAACAVARQHGATSATESRCPFLEESHVHYCAAAAVTRFVPYSDASLSRCGGGGFRSCELYLERRGAV